MDALLIGLGTGLASGLVLGFLARGAFLRVTLCACGKNAVFEEMRYRCEDSKCNAVVTEEDL